MCVIAILTRRSLEISSFLKCPKSNPTGMLHLEVSDTTLEAPGPEFRARLFKTNDVVS